MIMVRVSAVLVIVLCSNVIVIHLSIFLACRGNLGSRTARLCASICGLGSCGGAVVLVRVVRGGYCGRLGHLLPLLGRGAADWLLLS